MLAVNYWGQEGTLVMVCFFILVAVGMPFLAGGAGGVAVFFSLSGLLCWLGSCPGDHRIDHEPQGQPILVMGVLRRFNRWGTLHQQVQLG